MAEFLLAESGASKTQWIHYKNGEEINFATGGLNPNHFTDEAFLQKLKSEIPALKINGSIYYYGAGCGNNAQEKRVTDLLKKHFTALNYFVKSDLLGACMAVSNNSPSIVAILGTGAACCRFNGEEIIKSAPSLGYILGDEGSGASFGKKILAAHLKNELGSELQNKFKLQFNSENLSSEIYVAKLPAFELAEFFPFVFENKSNTVIKKLIDTEIEIFIKNNLNFLEVKSEEKINFCGSVAFYLQDEIKAKLITKNLQPGEFIRQPIINLLKVLVSQNS
jgi:N-acetylglucosamine kinase-like BadF-type ATPase